MGLDWSFNALIEACIDSPMTEASASIRGKKQAKKLAKAKRRSAKCQGRQVALGATALAFNKSIKNIIDKS